MAKRDEITIERDRARVSELMLMYRSPQKIAERINSEKSDASQYISVAQVREDIKAIKNYYINKQVENYEAVRQELLDELDLLRETYWEDYFESKKNKITIESEAVVEEDEYNELKEMGLRLAQDNERVFLRNVKIKEEASRGGNPAYLQGIQAVIDKKAKIYGVDAPAKVALTDPTGQHEASSPLAEIMSKLDEINNKEDKLLPETTEKENIDDLATE